MYTYVLHSPFYQEVYNMNILHTDDKKTKDSLKGFRYSI